MLICLKVQKNTLFYKALIKHFPINTSCRLEITQTLKIFKKNENFKRFSKKKCLFKEREIIFHLFQIELRLSL